MRIILYAIVNFIVSKRSLIFDGCVVYVPNYILFFNNMLCLFIPKIVGFWVNVCVKRSPPDQRHISAIQYTREGNKRKFRREGEALAWSYDWGLLGHRLRPFDMGTFIIMDYSEDLGV